MTPRDRETLEAIADSTARIDEYIQQAGPAWPSNPMAVDAIAKRIEQIGELAKHVSPETLAGISGVDWRGVKAARTVLADDYESVNVRTLDRTVVDDLPGLRAAVQAALSADLLHVAPIGLDPGASAPSSLVSEGRSEGTPE